MDVLELAGKLAQAIAHLTGGRVVEAELVGGIAGDQFLEREVGGEQDHLSLFPHFGGLAKPAVNASAAASALLISWFGSH